MTSFIGHINNTLIKFPIYFNSHMRTFEQIINIIREPSKFMYSCRTMVHTNMQILELFQDIYFFPEKILREPSIDFDVCNMSSSSDAGDINTNWLLIYFTIL